jgi:integrase
MAKIGSNSQQGLLPFGIDVKGRGQHTPGHVNCPVCEGTRTMYLGTISREMTFSQAVEFYLTWRTAPVAPGRVQFVGRRTLKDYRQKAKALKKFFGEIPLGKIHLGHLKEYQDARLNADGFMRSYGKRTIPSPAGPIKINSEIALLKRLMKMAACWGPELEMYYIPFQQMDPEVQRALSLEEQERFLAVAASNPRWQPIHWYALVAIHLTFSSDEMRTLRIGDINLPYQMVTVNPNFGKNTHRRRTVTVEDGTVLWALQNLIDRAAELGQTSPNYKPNSPHYFLFPRRVVRNTYNPELQMSETGLRKLFDEVCDASDLAWFQFNAFRHTGATRMAERRVPPFIMEKRMGHVGAKMMRRYVQIGEQAERIAMKEAFAKKPIAAVRDDRWRRNAAGY